MFRCCRKLSFSTRRPKKVVFHFTLQPDFPETCCKWYRALSVSGLVTISGNLGSAVNGKRFVGSSHWKIPGKMENLVGLFSRLERSERNFVFHLQASRIL